MLLRLTLLFVVCLLVCPQGDASIIGGVLRRAGRVIGGVGEGVGGVVGAVGNAVGDIAGDIAGGISGYDDDDYYHPRRGGYGKRKESPADSLASAAESLQELAKKGNSAPQITIQQIQKSDVE